MFYLKNIATLLLFAILFSCSNATSSEEEIIDVVINTPPTSTLAYKAADISYYPRIKQKNLTFFDTEGNAKDFLDILQENEVNTVRLRLWHTPANSYSSFNEVKTFSNELKQKGFKVWLTVHYSDTWADPDDQHIPNAWSNLSYSTLRDSVYNYTKKVVREMQPDLIQIGNEIDSGLLLPLGDINSRAQFLGLLTSGINAVREENSATKIMIHKADPQTATYFFDIVNQLDYDIIGVSYYPQWHGKSLPTLKQQLIDIQNRYTKDIILAETSYPFTLGWSDNTTNIIGSNDQIIYPAYLPTLNGQKEFLQEIREIVCSLNKGVGFGYWGAEWVAFEGPNATIEGSPWENQALFDFNFKAVPAIEVFKD